ncbi:glycoside hydrolase family 95 protein [Asticcacaulis sp. BYS171W]|uniref:Glycoside hydrolase family 95 protein n=1 Tax=Asticcacaulis aquaticus TaxID=2984212 RepID=A0ABT5HVP3_9CAUL|nr:glycoside hydrolase family 95 protein [Asticcacaulis aquaticus]MDC7684147.1 glycoside hydrolase family 95 protein [Asticcacaulis aquaticus]
MIDPVKPSRRAVLASVAVGTVAPTLKAAETQAEPPHDPRLSLWYDKPAAVWTEALPVGNGRLGAMVFGGIKRERLQLNEDTLWSGGPYHNVNPKGRAAILRVRELIFSGQYAEAEKLADADIRAVPMRMMSYQNAGDLLIDLPRVNETSVSGYKRELDLNTAVCRTSFTSEGIGYVREVISSFPANVIAVSLTATGGPLDADIGLSSGQRGEVTTSGDELTLTGVNNSDFDNPGRLKFQIRTRVVTDGRIEAYGPTLRVRGATYITVYTAIATSYLSPANVSGDPDALTRSHIAAVRATSFETLKSAHITDYRSLFARVALELPEGRGGNRTTASRVENAVGLKDPMLAVLYFQFGRYLLISSSRGTSQPANLQGIWNELNRPPWGSKYTLNINAEMNYWPADPANLSECLEPLVRMVEELSVTGARTARDLYGASGWVTHHNTDLWRASGPIDFMRTGLWPTGGAWLCVQLWDHYDYRRDMAFLRRIYPLMKGAAQFFVETLQTDPKTGMLVTNPSNSPENDHGRGSTLCAGPAMDMQILRDLFDHTIAAATILKTDKAFAAQLKTTRSRLPPDKIGKTGLLQEWQEDWDDTAHDLRHRHVSHLYGLFPSQQINMDETPDLAVAAKKSLDLRGDNATGWGVGWRLNLWAQLRDGERAHTILRNLLSPNLTYPNLFDAHPPFQIDGNFGGVRGIIEMLIQSRAETVHLLPALPKAWPDGRLTGIRLRGDVEADLIWKDGQPERLTLRATRAGQRTVTFGDRTRTVSLTPNAPTILSWS